MKSLTTVLLSAFITANAFTQTNFTGSYAFKEKQHIHGPEYINAVPTKIVIIQQKDSMIIETTATGADNQETTTRSSLSMNGSPVVSKSAPSNRKVSKNLKWSADKKSFTITSEIYKEGNDSEIELSRVDTWSLSADGKQLMFHRKSLETISENWEVNAIYDKH